MKTKSYVNVIEIAIAEDEKGFFDINDVYYINDWHFKDGTKVPKPPEFDLHLAMAILKRENVPDILIIPVKKWVDEHHMVGFPYESLPAYWENKDRI